MTQPQALASRWSSRAHTEQDRAEVLDLFTESDFYFRTNQPDTRPEWEILALLGEDTRVLLADGRPVGLYAISEEGAEHGCHYLLELRLRASAELSWWVEAYQEVVRALRWRHEVVRLALRLPEFDERGRQFARLLGLTEEGTLAGVTVHNGQRYGLVYFAQIWTPTS
jgi:hypothetical protein